LSGEIISERYFYKGELHGPEVERYKDGTKRNETAWVAGKEHGVGKRWHPNGAIYKTTYLDHGKIIGVLRWWHPDGTKELEKGYVNGKKHGLASEWYRNGQTAFQGEYVDGMKQGIIKEWHHNGQMRCEAEYVDGKKHGLWKRWYDNGTVREQWEYAKGSIVYSRPARVGHFLAKLQEVVSDGQYPVGFRCDYDEFMGVFGEPQGKQQKLRANVGRWTFDCSDGSVSLNEVTVGGTSVLLVKGLDTIRLRNLITENMSKGGFAKKIKEDRHSVHISWNYEEWLTAFGYPSVDSTLGRDHEKLWIYRCRDGNIMLTIEHTWNVSNGKILLPNRLMVKEIDY
jgi:antitoxin component YwqK of YwqJK toxin-antitoxin module